MDPATRSLPEDSEELTNYYLQRLEQVDRVLLGPARTLIRELRAPDPGKLPWAGERARGLSSRWRLSNIGRNMALVTGLRLSHLRRRFPALKHETEKLGGELRKQATHLVTPRRRDFEGHVFQLDSYAYGLLNPLTSAQMFRVFLESGENLAHSGMGCLSFFGMVWPLYRADPEDPTDVGARIEPAPASAYVAGKCVLPLIDLYKVCQQRADFAREIRKCFCEFVQHAKHAGDAYHDTRAISALEQLAQRLEQMAPISVANYKFTWAEEEIQKLLATIVAPGAISEAKRQVTQILWDALAAVASRNETGRVKAREIITHIRGRIVVPLKGGLIPTFQRPAESGRLARSRSVLNLPFEDGPSPPPAYLKILGDSANLAAELCEKVLAQIGTVCALDAPADKAAVPRETVLDQVGTVSAVDASEARCAQIDAFLSQMEAANREIARLVYKPVEQQVRWCETVMHREIVNCSAKNISDFDPAELITAVALAVRTKRLSTQRQLSDAVTKALRGTERDGSWRILHQYFAGDGVNGMRAPITDVVWTLTSAISHFPEIQVADSALFRFLDWLERTQIQITLPATESVSGVPSPQATESAPGATSAQATESVSGAPSPGAPRTDCGWAYDHARGDESISILSTCLALNALLALRNLVEHRLWELCQKEFTIVAERMSLAMMDPVDLIAPYRLRQQSRLMRLARASRRASNDAEYSVVLHGPPGSSKTTVAGALAELVWMNSNRWGPKETRLIRITPADFTRMGEERMDARARFIFRLLSHVRGVTILFDEVDDFLRRRDGDRPIFLDLTIPGMLNRLQDLREVCERQEICFIFGTNYIERIEPALIRKGRIDMVLAVTYPDYPSRIVTAQRILREDERVWKILGNEENLDLLSRAIAARTGGWPWAGIEAVCKHVRRELGDAESFGVEAEVASPQPFEELLACAAELDPRSNISHMYGKRIASHMHTKDLRREFIFTVLSLGGEKKDLGSFLEAQLGRMKFGKALKREIEREIEEDLRQIDGLNDFFPNGWHFGMKT